METKGLQSIKSNFLFVQIWNNSFDSYFVSNWLMEPAIIIGTRKHRFPKSVADKIVSNDQLRLSRCKRGGMSPHFAKVGDQGSNIKYCHNRFIVYLTVNQQITSSFLLAMTVYRWKCRVKSRRRATSVFQFEIDDPPPTLHLIHVPDGRHCERSEAICCLPEILDNRHRWYTPAGGEAICCNTWI